jgi:DNA-binding transcriptional ArsR family regulator
MEEKENGYETLEREVFKALDHQMRRDILRHVGEEAKSTFTAIMKYLDVDSPTLSYHLRALSPFIEQRKGTYSLTPIGKDAYNLLLRTTSYNKLVHFQREKYEVTVGNTILWVTAIAAVAYMGSDTIVTAVILPILAAISISTTYTLFK